MLFPITTTQLNELCHYLSETSYTYYPIVTDYTLDLLNTGARPKELLNQARWTYNSSSDIQLTPEKGNGTRFFTSTDLTTGLIFAIQNNVRPYQSLSLRQLESVLKKILPTPRVQTIDKSAISYMFRYNYIKQLSVNGMSDAAIAVRMGQSSGSVVAIYNGRQLYSTTQLPPLPPIMRHPYRLITYTNGESNTGGIDTPAGVYSIPDNKMSKDGDAIEFTYYGVSGSQGTIKRIRWFAFGTGFSFSEWTTTDNWLIKVTVTRSSNTTIKFYTEYKFGADDVRTANSTGSQINFTGAINTEISLESTVTGAIVETCAMINFLPSEL